MAQVTDNFHNDFPARMSDGRFITDYTPNCMVNLLRKEKMSSWEYRDYLTNNASQIHSKFLSELEASVKCTKCSDNIKISIVLTIYEYFYSN